MKLDRITKNAAYVGAGAGVALFTIIGLLPGSLVGGSVGVKIAGMIFGSPVTSQLLPRVTVALSMLLGVFISGIIFVACGAMTGWMMGNLIGVFSERAYFTGSDSGKRSSD